MEKQPKMEAKAAAWACTSVMLPIGMPPFNAASSAVSCVGRHVTVPLRCLYRSSACEGKGVRAGQSLGVVHAARAA